jgi:hypothetical protein
LTSLDLSDREIEELYVLLKPREESLGDPLEGLLARLEQLLFDRLTIEQIEQLRLRFSASS